MSGISTSKAVARLVFPHPLFYVLCEPADVVTYLPARGFDTQDAIPEAPPLLVKFTARQAVRQVAMGAKWVIMAGRLYVLHGLQEVCGVVSLVVPCLLQIRRSKSAGRPPWWLLLVASLHRCRCHVHVQWYASC